MNTLNKAISMLKDKHRVIPEKYTMYNGAYLFVAYAPDVKNKDQVINPLYLVDVKRNLVGPFSPAFDLDGFFKAAEQMKDL